jgi:primosomal protein N' (replication factor Y)
VVIQTFVPDHYAIALAKTHDYETFYREEVARRRPHGYPPFRSLLHLLLSSRDELAVQEAAQELAQLVELVPGFSEDPEGTEVLGPAPAPIARIKDQFRWQLLLLGSREALLRIGRDLAAQARSRFPRVTLRLVPAPVQML